MSKPAFQTEVDGGGVIHAQVTINGNRISVRESLQLMADDAAFRQSLTEVMTNCPFTAARFETPAATKKTLDNPFAFVLVDSPGLDRQADPSSFARQFDAADPDESVIVFPNLRGDATMIVPRPATHDSSFTHLLDFLRTAPAEHADALWALTGKTMLKQVGLKPLWLSTAGGGVPWLHVRIDERPKYYHYRPYTLSP